MPGRRIRHWRRRSRQFLRPLVTSTFRLAFLGGLLFAVTNIALLGVVRWTTGSLLDQSVDAAVDGEVAQLQSVFASGGVAGLTGELSTRMASLQGRQRVYLLIGSDRVPIIGNIAAWPDAKASPSGRLSFRLPRQFEDWGSRVRGGVADLPGCCLLLVGRLQTDRELFDRVIGGTMVGAGILCLFLGAVVGLVMARHALGRLDAINRIAAATRRGGFAERIQLSGSGDEFDQLAANLNAMLERNQRLLTAMRTVTRSVAHDLRTPLSRLRSRLESALLGEQAADLDGAQAAMAGAIRDVDGILATFNALLSIARIEGMTSGQDFAPVDLNRLVTDVAELYGPLAEDEGVALSVAVGPEAVIEGNAQLIFQALINLIDNAIKYSRGDGRVEIRLENDAGGIRLVVADNGPGIPEAQYGAVLEPFIRLDSSRHTPGVGLGLSVVAAVAELHEARLQLEDNRPGLRVVLAFPATAQPKRPVM